MTLIIDPAGGGDYTSLAAANSANPADGDWECRAGDVGGVTLTATNPTSFDIHAATGAKHNGSDAGNSGLAYSTGTIFAGTRTVPVAIRGLRMEATLAITSGNVSATLDRTVEDCLFAFNGTCVNAPGTPSSGGNSPVRNINIRRNVFYFGDPSSDNTINIISCAAGQIAGSGAGVVTGTINIEHNTVRQKSGQTNQAARCIIVAFSAAGSLASNMTLNVRNNVGTGAQTADFDRTIGAGSVTLTETWSHNASEDATADDYGATGALTGITVADCFTDPDADLHLKAGSPLIDAGVAIAGVNDGYLGSAPDIGFDEYVPPFPGRPAGTLALLGVGS